MKLPKHWQTAELQNLILTKKGKKPEKLSHIPFANSVPYLDIEAVEKNIVRQFANSENSVLSDENDLFIVWDGSRSGLISKGKKGVVGSTLMCITPVINKNYLFYFLQSQYENFNQTTTGTSIPHVNSEFFNTLNVPIAPLKEQTQIVSILDEIFEYVYSNEEISSLVKFDDLTKNKIKLTKEQINFIFNNVHDIFDKKANQNSFYNPIYILEVISSISSIEYRKIFDLLDAELQEILILELNKKYLFLEGKMNKKRIH
jgi:restriction endonuclease S subunit